MDYRIIRSLIYLFGGLIVVFMLLMGVNYIGSMTGERAEPLAEEKGSGKPENPEAMAQQALAAARYSAANNVRGSLIPGARQGLSTAAVNADGAINVVRSRDFGGVAESPKDMMSMLSEMAGGGKKKATPVRLSDSDFKKTIRQIGGGEYTKLKVSTMPEMGRGAGQEGLTMFTAPVDYKVFKSSDTWWAFANSHKCKQNVESYSGFKPPAGGLTGVDFASQAVLVLVSVSDLPNGIFRIVKVSRAGKAAQVGYKVDPMAMAAGEGMHDFYTAAVIPLDSQVKLTQLP